MAKQVTVTLVDDFDGTSKATETVYFSIDGIDYEIDLSVKNAGKLRAGLEPWSEKARKIGRSKRKAGIKGRSAGANEETGAIREWARAQGHPVSSRGRVPADLIEAYQKAKK
jgi:hypothetical protein